MTQVRKLGRLEDGEGKTVMEIFVPGGDRDALSDFLRALTYHVSKTTGIEAVEGLFGGAYGYGLDFENDTFLLHRYCWCEKDDCLWCGGSGCENGFPEDPPHTESCYQSRLRKLRERHGHWDAEWEIWNVGLDNKPYELGKKRLCEELDCDFEWGNERHCTCNAWEERKRIFGSCQCDWHLGKGRYRFGPAAQAPNFWYKPTDFRLAWYKYIGRGMELSEPLEGNALREMAEGCLASLGLRNARRAIDEFYEAHEVEAQTDD